MTGRVQVEFDDVGRLRLEVGVGRWPCSAPTDGAATRLRARPAGRCSCSRPDGLRGGGTTSAWSCPAANVSWPPAPGPAAVSARPTSAPALVAAVGDELRRGRRVTRPSAHAVAPGRRGAARRCRETSLSGGTSWRWASLDRVTRAELAASGDLFDTDYEPRMARVHARNAQRLRRVIRVRRMAGDRPRRS